MDKILRPIKIRSNKMLYLTIVQLVYPNLNLLKLAEVAEINNLEHK